MTVENEEMIRKMFDKIYGIACYGEHFNDSKNMGIPYEYGGSGKISELNETIYDLKCKMAEEFRGEKCDIDDYTDLCKLVSLYDDLIEEFSYKMFCYGLNLNSTMK